MKISKLLFLVFMVLTLIFSACVRKNNTESTALVVLSPHVRVILKKGLGLKSNESFALIVSFNDKEDGFLHVVEICLSDRNGKSCNLSKWFETNTHPSSLEFSEEIDQRWKKDFPASKIAFIEMLYYSEPAGKHKIESIYCPQSK